MNHTRLSRSERVARGLVATVFAVVFAAFSHLLAGGNTPSVASIAVTILVVLPLSIALARVRLSLVRLTALVVVGQGLFHASFSMIGSPGVAGTAVSTALSTASGIHAHHLAPQLAASQQLAESLALMPNTASVLMWLSHLGAAVATVWILRRGEQAAVTLFTIVLAALQTLRSALSHTPVLESLRLLPLPAAPLAEPVQLRLAHRASLRGPPPLSA